MEKQAGEIRWQNSNLQLARSRNKSTKINQDMNR